MDSHFLFFFKYGCILYQKSECPFSKEGSRKDSFLRALREVAPEMELFLENHWQFMKKIVIKLINIQSCTFRHYTKKLYLAGYF